VHFSLLKEEFRTLSPVFQAMVRPPAVKLLDGSTVRRPPILIGRVELASQASKSMSDLQSDETVHNSPVIGKWEIRIRSSGIALQPTAANLFRNTPIQRRPTDEISDVFLSLRVRARAVAT
jgi:hypothetical protein